MSYLFSIVVFGTFLLLAVAFDVHSASLQLGLVSYFLDLPSLVIVLIPALFFAAAATSWRGVGRGLRLVFGGGAKSSGAEVIESARMFRVFGNVSLLMGFLGTFVGAVLMLQNLSEISALFPATAVSLLTTLYGMELKLLCYVAEMSVRSRQADASASARGA